MKGWGKIILRAGAFWLGDNAFKHAAAVSFYTLFSLAPIVIIALTVAGFVFGEDAVQGELAEQLSGLIGEEGAVLVERAVAETRLEPGGWVSTMIGVALLLIGATTVFGQLQESLNQIWGVTAKPSRNSVVVLLMRRLWSLALVLTIGFLLLISLILTTMLTAVVGMAGHMIPVSPVVLRMADSLLALGVIAVLFALIFKVLPDVQLTWRDVWKGAFITSVLFGLGRFCISFYLGRSTLASTYGAAGSLVVVLLWVYYSCLILFFGVEFTRAYLHERGRPVRVKSKAVRVERRIIENDGDDRAGGGPD